MPRRTFIVAEMSANHEQSYTKAVEIVHAASVCGADAVKVQLYTPDSMTIDSKEPKFLIKSGLWKGSLYDLYKKTYMPKEWFPRLKEFAEKLGIILFTTVYDLEMIDFAEKYNNPIYKISSFEINYLDLIDKVAKLKKPMIISTGSATLNEIWDAVKTVRRTHNLITLLKCTSSYPVENFEMLNLRTIPDMGRKFKLPIGFSDHTTSVLAPVVAVTLGAKMIEKHFCINCKGLDGAFSILPERFKMMVDMIKATEQSLGKPTYDEPKTYHRKNINGKMIRIVR